MLALARRKRLLGFPLLFQRPGKGKPQNAEYGDQEGGERTESKIPQAVELFRPV